MNRSQRKFLGALLPPAAALILFILPIKGGDSRPLYLAIFFAILLVCYIEVLLFDLENRFRRLGKSFIFGFPVVAFVVAFLIATSPRIVTHPASWDPRAPLAYEAEQYLKTRAEMEAAPRIQADSADDAIQKALDRAKQGRKFEFYNLPTEVDTQRAVRLDAERGVPVESMTERITPAYKEALLDWKKTARFIPPKHSLELKDPIDRRVAPYWLALVLLIGTIEFRLLAATSVDAVSKKPPSN